MDGFGIAPKGPGNAVADTPKPNLDRIFAQCPGCRLAASGLDVGLPEGQMGNSEVGHTNMGAGRVVFQDLPRISRDIDTGAFFQNPAFLDAMSNCREWGSALHLMGLLSDGGVHSHINHLFRGWRRCMSTASWMAATCPPALERAMWSSSRPRCSSWAWARSPR